MPSHGFDTQSTGVTTPISTHAIYLAHPRFSISLMIWRNTLGLYTWNAICQSLTHVEDHFFSILHTVPTADCTFAQQKQLENVWATGLVNLAWVVTPGACLFGSQMLTLTRPINAWLTSYVWFAFRVILQFLSRSSDGFPEWSAHTVDLGLLSLHWFATFTICSLQFTSLQRTIWRVKIPELFRSREGY